MRPEVADHLHQRGDGLLQRYQRETTVGQRRQRVALGQPGVDETQPAVFDTEDLGRPGHLVAADVGDAPVHLGQVHRRVEDVATLATGQRHHQHPVAFGRVPRQGGRALAGLIVRMGVHGHQPQFGHFSL